MNNNNNKISYLDGLRGFAALIVVISHFVVGFYPALYTANYKEVNTNHVIELFIAKSPINILYNGNFCVCLFFVLSGYVLSNKFFYINNKQILISSIIKRYFRLAVPVLLSSFMVYIFIKLSLFHNMDAGKLTNSTWWLSKFWNFNDNFTNFLYTNLYSTFFKYSSKYNSVLWTMTYELLGSYLVFSVVIFNKFKIRYLIYLVCILLLGNTYYVSFVLGMILSDIKANNSKCLKLINTKVINFTILIIGLFLGSYPTGVNANETIYSFLNINYTTPYIIWHIVGAFLLMIMFMNSSMLQRTFSRKIFRFLGEISFSMYLIHLIVIGSFSSYMFIVLYKVCSYNVAFLIVFTLSMAIIIVISFLFSKIDMLNVKLINNMCKQSIKFFTKYN